MASPLDPGQRPGVGQAESAAARQDDGLFGMNARNREDREKKEKDPASAGRGVYSTS